jgi:hypothetical protein
VRHTGLQDHHLAGAEPMGSRIGLDGQLAPEAVNHHVARGAMLGQAAPGLEGEQQQAERPSMHQAGLAMAALGRVRLGVQGARQLRQIEGNHRSGRSGARMRPKPLV